MIATKATSTGVALRFDAFNEQIAPLVCVAHKRKKRRTYMGF
jgi:hypothetical protein